MIPSSNFVGETESVDARLGKGVLGINMSTGGQVLLNPQRLDHCCICHWEEMESKNMTAVVMSSTLLPTNISAY